MSKPTFVCVPAASHPPLIFERVKSSLAFYGYTFIPVALPSLGGRPPTFDFTEDVQTIRSLVAHLVESGKEVIVVMHAYGGIPGGEALQGLGKIDRERMGLRGGVNRLVFIMSCLAREGFQESARGDISAMPPWVQCNLETGISTINPQLAIDVFFNDLPKPEAASWASQLLPQSIGVFWSKTTYAAWRWIPSTYVLCGKDQCITLPYGEIMLRAGRESHPNMIDTIERCEEGGHCIMLSQVQWTVDMLRRAAGERTF